MGNASDFVSKESVVQICLCVFSVLDPRFCDLSSISFLVVLGPNPGPRAC